jgi:predicted amidohydrolase
MIHSAQYSQTWKTITSLLKVGDVLTIHFNGDRYANGYSHKTTLHIDGLNLDVKRGKQSLSFMVAVGVTPANSARMVKPLGY